MWSLLAGLIACVVYVTSLVSVGTVLSQIPELAPRCCTPKHCHLHVTPEQPDANLALHIV